MPKLQEAGNFFRQLPTVVRTTRPATVGFNPKINTPYKKKPAEFVQNRPKTSQLLEGREDFSEENELMFFLDYPDLSVRTYSADFRTYVRVGLVWDLYAGTLQYRKNKAGSWGSRGVNRA